MQKLANIESFENLSNGGGSVNVFNLIHQDYTESDNGDIFGPESNRRTPRGKA